MWDPKARSGGWNLRWHLFEVVRDQIIRVDTVESLATVEGDAPPARDTIDVREYAVVRVGDGGHAEWAVLKGPHRATQRIESDTERREVRDAAVVRATAMKRVDWDRRSNVHRQPAMAYIDADGCGNFQVYAWTADRAEALVVRVDGSALGLLTQPATFDLSREPVNVSVAAHVYAQPQRQFYFCSDVVMLEARVDQARKVAAPWRARLRVELSPPGSRARAPHLRRVTVTMNDVVLQNSAGTRVRVSGPVRLTAIVGSMGG